MLVNINNKINKKKKSKKELKIYDHIPDLKNLVYEALDTFNNFITLKAFKYNNEKLLKQVISRYAYDYYYDILLDKTISFNYAKKKFISRLVINNIRHKYSNYDKIVRNKKDNKTIKKLVLIKIKEKFPILSEYINKKLYSFY